jgi:hypothetical protein
MDPKLKLVAKSEYIPLFSSFLFRYITDSVRSCLPVTHILLPSHLVCSAPLHKIRYGIVFSGGVHFFLETGIVPSLLGFEVKERSIPKEQSMPVLSVLEGLFSYLSFTQFSVCHPITYLPFLQLHTAIYYSTSNHANSV